MKKRKVELVVISDVRLGTYGSHAKELLENFRNQDVVYSKNSLILITSHCPINAC